MRLIDADAIHYCEYDLDNYHWFRAAEEEWIAEMPTIDAVPVVHGRWIPIKVPTGVELLGIKEMVVGFIRCSKCDMEFDISCEWYSHYCPCAIYKNADTRCMCKDFREQETPGPCHCGRYAKVEDDE